MIQAGAGTLHMNPKGRIYRACPWRKLLPAAGLGSDRNGHPGLHSAVPSSYGALLLLAKFDRLWSHGAAIQPRKPAKENFHPLSNKPKRHRGASSCMGGCTPVAARFYCPVFTAPMVHAQDPYAYAPSLLRARFQIVQHEVAYPSSLHALFHL